MTSENYITQVNKKIFKKLIEIEIRENISRCVCSLKTYLRDHVSYNPNPPPGYTLWNFFLFPHTFQDDVFAINYISIAFPMKQFSFKFILRVIVYDSDTNFVHSFPLCMLRIFDEEINSFLF